MNTKLADLEKLIQEEPKYIPMAAMFNVAVEQSVQQLDSNQITRDEFRAKMSTLFHDLALALFSEMFSLADAEPTFSPSTETSKSSFDMKFRHKSIKIRLNKSNDVFSWDFSVEPLSELKEDFDRWQKYADFPDVTILRDNVLMGRTVLKKIDSGREGLLSLLVNIDQKYQADMASFEEIKKKALEKKVLVEEQSRLVQEWNDRLYKIAQLSENKLDLLIAEAEKEAWVWPEGKTLTLFQFVWQTGCAVEDGIAYPAHEIGWSLSDISDENGYFDFLPEVDNCCEDEYAEQPTINYLKKARKIKPIFLTAVQKVEFSDLESLPFRLCTTRYLSVEAISYPQLICRDSGSVEQANNRIRVLKSEAEAASLKDFPGFSGRKLWFHVRLERTPIEQIRSAAV